MVLFGGSVSVAALRSDRPVFCARVSGSRATVVGGNICLLLMSLCNVVSLCISLRVCSVVQPKSFSSVSV